MDLSQPLGTETILWPGSRPFTAHVTAEHDPDGHYVRNLDLPEHAGTHVDAPSHFAPGGSDIADIPLAQLLRPAVVLDVADLVGDDAAYALDAATIERIEARDGDIPAGAAVLVRTGWDRFVGDPERYIGAPGPACPGIGVDAARLLVERGVAGIGIDSLGIDPGHLVDCPAHRITLGAGLWHLEGLVRLEHVPPRGATVVVGVPRLSGGSGCPARVFAILPHG